jgi:hypothetical protein
MGYDQKYFCHDRGRLDPHKIGKGERISVRERGFRLDSRLSIIGYSSFAHELLPGGS